MSSVQLQQITISRRAKGEVFSEEQSNLAKKERVSQGVLSFVLYCLINNTLFLKKQNPAIIVT